jgi:hypothetical protein
MRIAIGTTRLLMIIRTFRKYITVMSINRNSRNDEGESLIYRLMSALSLLGSQHRGRGQQA